MKHWVKKTGAMILAGVLTATPCMAAQNSIEAIPGMYGYFVDQYKTNTTDNKSPETNAVIGALSGFLNLWQPGNTWNNGIKLGTAGETVLNANIQKCIEITNNRTEAEGQNAYLIDRRNQNYTALNGLGKYTQAFKDLTNAKTSISDEIPADASTKKYSDSGNENGEWADETSELGSMVKLINTLRGPYASGNPAKYYFQYMRPFRWSESVKIYPSLVPCIGSEPEKDGGFPSGHTNAGYLASFALAYATPEYFQQCLTNASYIGNSRIVAGMHSPLDVIGGRVMATALAAAALNDPENQALKQEAWKEAHNLLLNQTVSVQNEAYTDHKRNKEYYEACLTYGLPQTGDTTKPAFVPKGAEVLLETRFPYLDQEQRRWVLASTELPSGYEFLDDAEGWGRLNLFAASDGYGAFDGNVKVVMDESRGGFCAKDTWQNDISGQGGLYKYGSGELILNGDNSYTGGTHITEGTITLAGNHAAGNGVVFVNGGTLQENVIGEVNLASDYTQSKAGTLTLNISSEQDLLNIEGNATLNGTLSIQVSSGVVLNAGAQIIKADSITGSFNQIHVSGLSENQIISVHDNGVFVENK